MARLDEVSFSGRIKYSRVLTVRRKRRPVIHDSRFYSHRNQNSCCSDVHYYIIVSEEAKMWADVVTVISAFLLAIFTMGVWALEFGRYKREHHAILKVYTSRAHFDTSTQEVRVEVIFGNVSNAPAVAQNWTILIHDGDFRDNISDGDLGFTRILKAPKYISAPGWVITREEPAALCITKKLALTRDLSDKAEAYVELSYEGPQKNPAKVSTRVPIVKV